LYRVTCDGDTQDLAAFCLRLINEGIVPRVAVPFQNESERQRTNRLKSEVGDFKHPRS
jgi:hypothetical protein